MCTLIFERKKNKTITLLSSYSNNAVILFVYTVHNIANSSQQQIQGEDCTKVVQQLFWLKTGIKLDTGIFGH